MSSKEIPLTQGKVAIVDEEDFEWLKQYKWCAIKGGNTFYAVRNGPRVNGRQRFIQMHREILGLKPGDPGVDHRDGDGLNNRKENLRVAGFAQNAMNSRSRRGTSRFKGVTWHKVNRKWIAQIMYGGKHQYLGSFDSEEEAARAYDERAKELFGEFARLNKVGEDDGRKAEDQF